MTANFKMRWVKSSAEIKDHLWSICFAQHLEGKWWYETLERSKLDEQFEFLYGVISSNGTDVGIVPAFVMNVPIALVLPEALAKGFEIAGNVMPGLKYQRTFFIGSPFSDEGTIGLVPPLNLAQVAELIQKSAKNKAREFNAPMLVWKDFGEESQDPLNKLATKMGLFKMVSYPGAVVRLVPKGGVEKYFETLKRSRRQKIRKKLRNSAKIAKLDSTVEESISAETLNEVYELFFQTYTKGTTKFERLSIDFFQEIARKPYTRWVLLREAENGKLVAFMLCFQLGDKIINKFIGLDYTKDPEWFLYFRLWESAITWVASTDAIEFQSGQTGYSAKIELGHDLVPLNNYCQHSNFIVHKIYDEVAKGISWSTLDKDLAVFLQAHAEADPEPAGAKSASKD